MRQYEGYGLGAFYRKILDDLEQGGKTKLVRGQAVKEFEETVLLSYEQPGQCFMVIPGRKFNPFFALAEVLWMWTGRGDAEWISHYNKNILEFLDEGKSEFHGAYGLRVRNWWGHDQIHHVVRKLREDPNTRQAVISLWDPTRDNDIPTLDRPCNVLIMYRLKEGKLQQTVVQRSNDLVWGTPYNAVQFSHLHALVAGELGVEIGTLHYIIHNLHYYTNKYPEALDSIKIYKPVPFNWMIDCGGATLPHFQPVTDSVFKESFRKVNGIKEASDFPSVRPIQQRIEDLAMHTSEKDFYWLRTLPTMVGLYSYLKCLNTQPLDTDQDDINFAVQIILELPVIFRELTFDFYKDSKSAINREVINRSKLFTAP